MMSYTVVGADQVITRLARIPQDAATAQHTVVKALGDRYLHVLQDNTPVGKGENPGKLKAGYEVDQSSTPTSASYKITNVTPYLRWVLNGRGAVHAISAKALRFVIGGQVIYRRSVKGAAANQFADRARAQMQGDIDQAGQQIAGLIVR